MKKSLIILAALCATSGAAVAQSSVTLYGLADIGIGKAGAVGEKKWGAETSNMVNGPQGSFIGVKGREDMGDGLWAGFDFEGSINLATGQSGGWSDSAWVALGSNNWGTFTLGRNYTAPFTGQVVYELTGWARYSVIANTYGFGGYPDPRSNAQIEYSTPAINGVRAQIAYVTKANGALVDNGLANTSEHWAGNITYVQGPIKAALTLDKPNHTDPAKNSGPYADKLNWTVGGSYTFNNMFALAASYNRTNNAQRWPGAQGTNAAWGVRRFGWELGGSFFTGPFTVTLDLTRDTKNDLYGGKKYTNALLEAKYALSKRTYLYADYLRLDGYNNYGIGIHHSF